MEKLRLGEGTPGEQLDLNPGLHDSQAQALIAVPQLLWALLMSSKAAEVLPSEGVLSPEVVAGVGSAMGSAVSGGGSVGRTGRSLRDVGVPPGPGAPELRWRGSSGWVLLVNYRLF